MAAEEGRDLADTIGDRLDSRQCRYWLAMAQLNQGDPTGAAAQFRVINDEAEAAHDLIYRAYGLAGQGFALAWYGDVDAARSAADASLVVASELVGFIAGLGHSALGVAALAAGDGQTRTEACDAAWQYLSETPGNAVVQRAYNAQAALAVGDLDAARRWADDAVSTASGWHQMVAFTGARPGGDGAGGPRAGGARRS